MAKTATVCPRNTVLTLGGRRYQLCHEVLRIDRSVEADLILYGHGLTGEERTPSKNACGTALCYNATWGPSLHVGDAHLVI